MKLRRGRDECFDATENVFERRSDCEAGKPSHSLAVVSAVGEFFDYVILSPTSNCVEQGHRTSR